MREKFGYKSKYKLQVIIPQRPILSVVEGAAYFGITPNYIKARRMTKTYSIGIKRTLARAKELGIPLDLYIEGK